MHMYLCISMLSLRCIILKYELQTMSTQQCTPTDGQLTLSENFKCFFLPHGKHYDTLFLNYKIKKKTEHH